MSPLRFVQGDCELNENEYWESNGDYEDDDEIIREYLIEEEDDLTLVMLPKLEYDFDKEFEVYYSVLKKCRTKDQMKQALGSIIERVSSFTLLQNDIGYLQERAKELEFRVAVLSQEQMNSKE